MRRFIACVLLPSYLAACMVWEVREVSPQQVVAQEQPSEMHLTLTDGSWVVLKQPRISGDSLVGILAGGVYRGRELRQERPVGIHLGDVAQVAVSRKSARPAVWAVAAAGAVVFMAGLIGAFGELGGQR